MIIHIDESPAEIDAHYVFEAGMVGEISDSLGRIAAKARLRTSSGGHKLHDVITREIGEFRDDAAFPVKPQKIIWALRQALDKEDIVISDVDAHKIWIARMYQAEAPDTCIISNGFAAMGIALPGAIAAKLALPDRKVVAVWGDAGFLMNGQENGTALRLKLDIVLLIFNDAKYGLI